MPTPYSLVVNCEVLPRDGAVCPPYAVHAEYATWLKEILTAAGWVNIGEERHTLCGKIQKAIEDGPEVDLTGRRPSEPQMQNIPIRTEEGTKIRDAFLRGIERTTNDGK